MTEAQVLLIKLLTDAIIGYITIIKKVNQMTEDEIIAEIAKAETNINDLFEEYEQLKKETT